MESFAFRARQVLGFDLTGQQLTAFQVYTELLKEWNQKVNLTAIRDNEQIENKHFLDSISTIAFLKKLSISTLIDIGTGAGFPGIPIKLLLPEVNIILVESIGKKVGFCRAVIEKLHLEGISVIQTRAEELGQSLDYRERFDIAIARAVANLDILAEFLLPFVKLGGHMLAQKGHTGPLEAQKAEHAFQVLGGKMNRIEQVTLPGISEDRFIIIVDKVASTPTKYPRRVGIPAKRRLLD